MRTETDTSLLIRLAASRDGRGEPFLDRHHLAAGERLERLIARAQLGPRLTMSYDPAKLGGRSQGNAMPDLADSAADARKLLDRLAGAMPPECWSVAVDVCGFGKGLQLIETEQGWPRRSAKLVLRIALEYLALQFGVAPHRAGLAGGRGRAWLEQRLPLIAEKEV